MSFKFFSQLVKRSSFTERFLGFTHQDIFLIYFSHLCEENVISPILQGETRTQKLRTLSIVINDRAGIPNPGPWFGSLCFYTLCQPNPLFPQRPWLCQPQCFSGQLIFPAGVELLYDYSYKQSQQLRETFKSMQLDQQRL